MDEIEAAVQSLIEQVYNYKPTFIDRVDSTTISWRHNTVKCIVTSGSIKLTSFTGPVQSFELNENGIQQAASKVMEAIILEEEYTQEFYGDMHGVINR